MGVFDWVVLEGGAADLGIDPGETFQTKSLEPGLCRYLVSDDGRLCVSDFDGDLGDRTSTKEEIKFHGDILLFRCRDSAPREVVARFSDGRLEWIRPLEAYSLTLAEIRGWAGGLR
jgi:hypothetical protein